MKIRAAVLFASALAAGCSTTVPPQLPGARDQASSLARERAVRGASRPLEPTQWDGPEGQTCYADEVDLPPLGSVFDSARMASAADGLEMGKALLLSVAIDSLSELRAKVIESSLSAGATEVFLDAVEGSFDPVPGVKLPPARLLIEGTGATAPAVRLGYRQICEPLLLNQEAIATGMQRAGLGPSARGTAIIRVRVVEIGIVTESKIAESSGNAEVDAAALAVAGGMRFLPLLVDRAPASVWVGLPISVR